MPLNNTGYIDKSIAVIGVSHDEAKFGFRIFSDLLKRGFKVEGVNPKNGLLLGKKIFKDLKEFKNAPEMVITVVPPEVTEELVDTCINMGVKEIWMQPGSESENAIKKAELAGIKVTYNACFMINNKIW